MKCKTILWTALLWTAIGYSQSEFVNSSFAGNGLLCVNIPGETIKMGDLIKVDDHYYGLANFVNHHLVKFTSTGQLVTSFGNNGYKPVNIGYGQGGLGIKESHILTTPDNNLLIVGIFMGALNNHFITKTDMEGNVITSFGTNGLVPSWGTDKIIFHSVEIVNNEIVLVGAGNDDTGEAAYRYLIVMKYDLNGNPITTFGTNGSLLTYIDSDVLPLAMHYNPDAGNITMAGAYYTEENNYSLVAKYDLATGLPDSSFGTNGQIIYDSESETFFTGLTTMYSEEGSFYTAGYEIEESQLNIFLNKLDQNGQPDTAFGTNGTYRKFIENSVWMGASYITKHNNNLLITGHLKMQNNDYEKILLLNITTNGTEVSDFGNNGMIINPMNLAHYGSGFKTLSEGNLITVATLSKSCTSADAQPKPAVVQFITGELSTGENPRVSQISYYPNPVRDNLIIASDNQIDTAEIYGTSGKLLSVTNRPESNTINLSQLQSGLYLIRVHENGNTKNIRIIKE